MARGFKIADAYVELTVDRDAAKEGVRDLPRDVGPDADRAGREIGDRIGKGLAASVETWSARVAKARRAEVDAAAAVTLAEKRLDEARKRGVEGSSAAMLSLTQNLEKAQYRLSSAQAEVIRTTGQQQEAQKKLAASVAEMAEKAGPEADRGGRALGDKLSQGISMSIVRNSPLIVAGIAAALVAGAPVALAGATALFAGIGIVAAAQSEKVRSAWLGTWQGIKAGAQADARPIEDVLVTMAARVGAGFERLRPSLRNIFTDAAPQMTVFTNGILGLANNAMPGFERAIARGMPVTRGFADFLEKTGTGLTGFLDGMSEHSEAAGQAFSLIGDVLAELLPMLGDLLGQGAELAVMVLPAVVTALRVVNSVLDAVGGSLPMVLTGFLAFKALTGITSIIQRFAGSLTGLVTPVSQATAGMGVMSRTATGIVSALGGPWGAALAGAGILVGLFTAEIAKNNDVTQRWAEGLRSGGAAARQAMDEARAEADKYADNWGGALSRTLDQWAGLSPTIEDAEAANRKYWQSLDPVAQAQSKVAEWSSTLKDRLNDESASTADVEAAKRRLAHWQQEAARLANAEALAIRGVTEAMVEQANQSRSLVDAQFAYENSVNGVEDAQIALNEAIKAHGADSEEAQRATLALNEALSTQAQNARRVAESGLPASMDDSQRAILGAKAELDELNRIAAEYTLPPELEAHRQKLEAITGQANGAMLAQAQLAAAVGELGFAVSAVPGEKHITITAPTDELRQRLADLGFTIIQLPNGDIQVIAETAEAQAKLGTLATDLVGLNNTTATPTADLNPGPFTGVFGSLMNRIHELAGQRPVPVADLNPAPLVGQTKTSFGLLDVLGGQRPTPVAQLDPGPLNANAGGAFSLLGVLSGQRPTPVAGLDAGQFHAAAGHVSGTMNWLNAHSAYPYVTAIANVRDAEQHLAWVSRNRTVTIWTNTITDRKTGGPVIAAAGGRKVVGPGGPTDDQVPAVGPGGALYRLSNTEWIINALVSRQQGDGRMAALNAGLADIVLRSNRTPASRAGAAPPTVRLPGEVRRPDVTRFAGGGSPGQVSGGDRVVTTAPGRTVTVEHVSVHIAGTFDLASSSDLRKAALAFRQALIDLDREQS